MGHYNLKYGSIGSPVEYDENEPRCYTDEWKRTSPDYVVYLAAVHRDRYGQRPLPG